MLSELTQDKFRKILLIKLETLKRGNPNISSRAFAKKLGLSSGALSELLNGKRSVTENMINKLKVKLELSPAEMRELYQDIDDSDGIEYSVLDMNHFSVLSEGIHFSILALSETSDFILDYKWISKRIGYSEVKVEQAISKLASAGLIKLNKAQDHFEVCNSYIQSNDDIASLAVKKGHRETLKEAEKSLDDISLELRDLTSLTLAVHSSSMKEIKEEIRRFRKRINKISDQALKKNEVYKLAVQFFPVTQVLEKERNL
jgi:uncharacterized protein (TIGR02147 family)